MKSKYTLARTDVFNQAHYPAITEELRLFKQSSVALPNAFKAAMLISFVKDHMIRSEYVRAYPELVSHITSRHTVVKHLEYLFESCCTNVSFQKDFEIYIIRQLE
jgi:hypothetical protein